MVTRSQPRLPIPNLPIPALHNAAVDAAAGRAANRARFRGRWLASASRHRLGGVIGRKADPLCCQALFQLADLFFHLLARLKGYDEFLRDIDALSGPRVTCLARRPCLHLENP